MSLVKNQMNVLVQMCSIQTIERCASVICACDISKPRHTCMDDVIQNSAEKADKQKMKTCLSSSYAQDTQD